MGGGAEGAAIGRKTLRHADFMFGAMGAGSTEVRCGVRGNPHGAHASKEKSATQVSLSDWLALLGKDTGGLKTPGYSRTVLRTENAEAYAALL